MAPKQPQPEKPAKPVEQTAASTRPRRTQRTPGQAERVTFFEPENTSPEKLLRKPKKTTKSSKTAAGGRKGSRAAAPLSQLTGPATPAIPANAEAASPVSPAPADIVPPNTAVPTDITANNGNGAIIADATVSGAIAALEDVVPSIEPGSPVRPAPISTQRLVQPKAASASPTSGTGRKKSVPGEVASQRKDSGAKELKAAEALVSAVNDVESPKAGKKRSREGVDGAAAEPERSPKSSKTRAGGKQAEESRTQEEQSACSLYERRIRELHARAALDMNHYDDPVTINSMPGSDDVFRAINSVTEAVMLPDGTNRFALLSDTTLQMAAVGNGDATGLIVRPHAEVMIPHTAHEHISLLIARRDANVGDSNAVTFLHRDSARAGGHWGRRNTIARDLHKALHNSGWLGLGTQSTIPVELDPTTSHQESDWSCGIHTILNAWAWALGLDVVRNLGVDVSRDPISGEKKDYALFMERAAGMIRLAVRGYTDSATIAAFLECYGFVAPGQTVPADRHFDSTVPMRTEAAMMQYVRDRQRGASQERDELAQALAASQQAAVQADTDVNLQEAIDESLKTGQPAEEATADQPHGGDSQQVQADKESSVEREMLEQAQKESLAAQAEEEKRKRDSEEALALLEAAKQSANRISTPQPPTQNSEGPTTPPPAPLEAPTPSRITPKAPPAASPKAKSPDDLTPPAQPASFIGPIRPSQSAQPTLPGLDHLPGNDVSAAYDASYTGTDPLEEPEIDDNDNGDSLFGEDQELSTGFFDSSSPPVAPAPAPGRPAGKLALPPSTAAVAAPPPPSQPRTQPVEEQLDLVPSAAAVTDTPADDQIEDEAVNQQQEPAFEQVDYSTLLENEQRRAAEVDDQQPEEGETELLEQRIQEAMDDTVVEEPEYGHYADGDDEVDYGDEPLDDNEIRDW